LSAIYAILGDIDSLNISIMTSLLAAYHCSPSLVIFTVKFEHRRLVSERGSLPPLSPPWNLGSVFSEVCPRCTMVLLTQPFPYLIWHLTSLFGSSPPLDLIGVFPSGMKVFATQLSSHTCNLPDVKSPPVCDSGALSGFFPLRTINSSPSSGLKRVLASKIPDEPVYRFFSLAVTPKDLCSTSLSQPFLPPPCVPFFLMKT